MVTNEAEEVILYEPRSFISERVSVNPDSPRHFKNKRRRNNINSKMKRRPKSFNFIDGREEKTKKTTLRALKAYHSCDNDASKSDIDTSIIPFELSKTTQFSFEEEKEFSGKVEEITDIVKNTFISPRHKTLTASASNSSGFCDLTGTDSDEDDSSDSCSSIAPLNEILECTQDLMNTSEDYNSRDETSDSIITSRFAYSMNSLDDIDSGIGNSVFTPEEEITSPVFPVEEVFTNPTDDERATPPQTRSLYEKRNLFKNTLDRYVASRHLRSKSIDFADGSIDLTQVNNKKKSRKISIEQCVEKLTLYSRRSNSHGKLTKKNSKEIKEDALTITEVPAKNNMKNEKKRRITVTLPLPNRLSGVFSNIRIESVV